MERESQAREHTHRDVDWGSLSVPYEDALPDDQETVDWSQGLSGMPRLPYQAGVPHCEDARWSLVPLPVESGMLAAIEAAESNLLLKVGQEP